MNDSAWRIERLVPGGDGMTRLADGRVGFAMGALPGDLVRALELEQHKSWVRAKRWELVEPGSDRVTPPCPVADSCGGCDWMHLARPAQLSAKRALVRETLRRTGKISAPPEIPIHSPGPDLGYRCRLRLHVDPIGRLGMYAKQSHELVEIPGCPVSVPEVSRALEILRQTARAHPGVVARWAEIEIRAAPAGPPVTIWLEPRERATSRAPEADAFLAELRASYVVAERGGPIDPSALQRWALSGVELAVPPGAFVQVNPTVNRELVAALVERATELGVRRFLDLYSGAGNFSLPLLAAGMIGMGVERAGVSIRAARLSARAAGLDDQSFRAGEVSTELERLERSKERFDLVVLDPPREGAREILARLIALGPPNIAYCACDPVTLARDLRSLLASGYRLDSVTAWDMFPHTHHVETLAWLRR